MEAFQAPPAAVIPPVTLAGKTAGRISWRQRWRRVNLKSAALCHIQAGVLPREKGDGLRHECGHRWKHLSIPLTGPGWSHRADRCRESRYRFYCRRVVVWTDD